MDEYLVRTAKALEIARMRSGLSQQKLAARMGVNRGTVANWGARSGSHFPSDGYALVHLLRRIGGSIHGRLHSPRAAGASGRWPFRFGETEGSHRCYDGVFLLRNRCPVIHSVRRSRFRPHRRTDGDSGKPPHAVEGQGRCLPDGVW